MRVPIDISSATVRSLPFPHFLVADAVEPAFASEFLNWLERDAPWKLVLADFYEQYEFSLYDAELPSSTGILRERPFLCRLIESIGCLFEDSLDEERIDITVHKLVPGQRIRIHNDFIPGLESHRLLVQLNRDWSEDDGGLLMLFAGPSPDRLCQLVRPLHRSAFGFEISPQSHHAVAPVIAGARYTLVYSFYRKAL